MDTIAFAPARWLNVFRRPLDREMAVYFVGSGLDVLLTYVLLHGDGPWVFVESNPVANYFLQQGGFTGMVLYKILLVGIVLINCRIIAKYRPHVALNVIRFAVAAVLMVVLYSSYLLWQYA